ncbi:MAG: hypothetical protein PVI79_12965 [Gammaproteobacteria bacterium]
MRHTIAGILILLMIVITVSSGLGLVATDSDPLWIAGGAAWIAALLLFPDTTRILKIQVSILLAIGVGLILFAHGRGASVDTDFIIGSSTGLMTMIASVGFLRLVVIPDKPTGERLPVGHGAFLRTLLGLNIASSVINISAPILITDRIHAQRPLARFTAQSFVRVFCGVSSWSPFFGAMAVVLTYVAGASLLWIIVAGFPFMLVGFAGVYLEARLRYPEEVENFVGYPTHLDALKVPAILIVTVLLLSQLLRDRPILVLIAVGALLVTTSVLALRRGIVGSITGLREYVIAGLPRIVNELCLFLSAGVLAAGISALIRNGVIDNPFSGFDAVSAAETLVMIVFCAFCGIHPIIMISSITPMLLTLDPDPNLLAATYLLSWHLGTCSNPLSGTNLVFQGRYGIPSWKLAFWNWPYALAMLVVGCLWLQIVARILPSS